jgi:hypothetical protein
MLKLRLASFAAWAPGLEDEAAWRHWAAAPVPLGGEGAPDVEFLPAMLRRRCSRLTRMMLRTARDACSDVEWSSWPSVFASRHGTVTALLELLDDLAERRPLSPTRFSHSVHNASAGLFSIAAGNKAPSSSVAAGADTFSCALLEAAARLARTSTPGVLVVMADEPLPTSFLHFADEQQAAYGLALRLERDGEGGSLELSFPPLEAHARPPAWPLAVEFLRALLQGESEVRLRRMRVGFGDEAKRAASPPLPISPSLPSAGR